MSSSSYSFRNFGCPCFRFEYFTKGYQVKFEDNNNTVKQFIPFAQILSHRWEFLFDEKLYVVTVILKQDIKYTYCFKCEGDATSFYEKVLEGLAGPAQ